MAGLWLGCGRGVLTQWLGLSCDSMLAIEYVDARGDTQYADAEHNADMFWLARGGGGEFPGVVTHFTAQAYPEPSVISLRSLVCTAPPPSMPRVAARAHKHAHASVSGLSPSPRLCPNSR